ncbi:MAG TPA: amino acid permease [Phycisphaerales bacterium]|nr:amino acid permease [Phycisphaerales bacterium]
MPTHLERSIGLWGGLGVMMGIIIGGGIFATPAAIADHLASPALILALWAVGGLLALFGALTYAELAAMHPESGGVYIFLREGFGRCVAFTFGWSYLLLTKPLGAAALAMIFADHFVPLAGLPRPSPDTPAHLNAEVWTTIALLTLLTIINVRGVRLGAAVAVALTSFKYLVLLGIILLALLLQRGDAGNFAPTPAPGPLAPALVPVMAAILWTYDGWSDFAAVAGEVKDPGRSLSRIYFLGIAAVIAAYLAINAVYIWIVPLPDMRPHDTIAPLVVHRLLGPESAVVVTIIILLSVLGSSHGSVLTGARVSYAQAQDGLLFRALAHVHPRYHTPDVSLWVQLALSIAAVWRLKTFEALAGGFVFTMWIFYGLAAGAIFVLRARRPDAPRPYRCWGYPIVPALFVLAAAGMTALSIWEDLANPDSRGMRTLPWLAVLAAGAPAYWLWTRVQSSARTSR